MWIDVINEQEIPGTGAIVEDENGWIGQAYRYNNRWLLESFAQTTREIEFGKIIRYFEIPK